MPMIVVGGTTRKAGKTALICGLIAAFPECPWTAIKMTSHDHGEPEPVCEETRSGQGTDTARYLAAGARRAFLITTRDGKFPEAALRDVLVDDRWLIFETNQVQSLPRPDIILALIGSQIFEPKPSFAALVRIADAVVYEGPRPGAALPQSSASGFILPDLMHPSRELIQWMRRRLGLPAPML
jgi:hypothetical protein